MTSKSKTLLMAAATLCCGLFLFGCGSNSEPNSEEETRELESVKDMVKSDSLKMDSLKKKLLNQ
jgi:hypothetical protein